MRDFIFNPINNKYPSGACANSTSVKYFLKINKFNSFEQVFFVMHKDGENDTKYSMTRTYADEKYIQYEIEQKYDDAGFYWYHFECVRGDEVVTLYRDEFLDATSKSNNRYDFLQLVYSEESHIAKAFHKGIIYHIFVDRFHRAGEVKTRNGLNLIDDWNTPVSYEFDEQGERVNYNCYGGNFDGIIEKLDYLKELNVSTIYLSPIFEANSSHKYDIADYSKVDSMFGGRDKLIELINKAKELDIQVIIDGVFNHTGSDSVYFNKNGRYRTIGAYQNVNSKYYSWYKFDKYPDVYSCWWGIKILPETNENSTFFDYIAGKNGIIEKYMGLGIAGYRLDVADELSNKFLSAICKAARNINPEAIMIGEVWEDASTKISYDERKNYFLGGNLDSVTNYPMKNAILEYVKYGRVENLVNVINLIKDQYPVAIQNNLMNILDTHDSERALTYLGRPDDVSDRERYILSASDKLKAINLLKLAVMLQYTVMGIPTVFYGDEVGIEGTKDPYCREPFPWDNMELSLLEFYQKMGRLRDNKVLVDGVLNIKYAQDGVLIFERVKNDKKVLVVINRSEQEFDIVLEKTMCNYFTGEYRSGRITIKANDGQIFI